MPDPFSLPFFQRGIAEILILAVASGLLGTWIVMRGFSFFAHAAGTATFPGLVLADGLGFSAALGAFGAALVVAVLVGGLASRRSSGNDSATALVLAGALAVGVILASDVFHSQSNVDRLLFGSLLAIDRADLLLAAATAVAVAAASFVLGPRWLATGFAGERSGAQRASDAVLVVLIALAAVAALAAVGSLLATAILVVPAATTRLFTDRLHSWQAATVACAAAEGVLGMWIAFQMDVPPGAAIAVLGGGVFALAALVRVLVGRRAPRAALVLAVVALAGGAVSGCGAAGNGSGKPVVVATTTQLADLAREVGGPDVEVRQILRPSSDPHEYEPRPSDVQSVAGADVVLVSGLGLDGWASSIIKDSGTSAKIVDVGASVPVKRAGSGAEAGGEDPHWWHDPANFKAAAATVAAALKAVVPGAAADGVARRARAYQARLEALDTAIRACVDELPAAKRKIVTSHDAFGYFTARYGITTVGAVIPSNTTQAQASARSLAKLEETIRREHVKAVFPETSINPKLAKRISADTGASARYTLYGDALGPAGSRGATYVGMEQANADELVRGMSGGKASCPASR